MQPASNRQLTLLRKLNRKKYREKERLFFIEGGRAVQQLIQNGQLMVEGLFFDRQQGWWEEEFWQAYSQTLSCHTISAGDFKEISDTENPQGVLAVCRMPQEHLQEQMAAARGTMIAADAIQDPGNLGTIIRTACWFGATGILLGKGTVDLFNPKVVRSTAGATGILPYRTGRLEEDLGYFEQEGWQVYLLDGADDAADIRSLDPGQKIILVVGNEANGISSELFTQQRKAVRIPSSGDATGVESLNAAIATAIALFALNGNR